MPIQKLLVDDCRRQYVFESNQNGGFGAVVDSVQAIAENFDGNDPTADDNQDPIGKLKVDAGYEVQPY